MSNRFLNFRFADGFFRSGKSMFTRIGKEILTSFRRAIFATRVSRVIISHPIQSESASSLTVTIAMIFNPHSSPRLYFAPSSDIATRDWKSLGTFAKFAEKSKSL